MKKQIILSVIFACATSIAAQQKLPCKVADLDAAMEEYEKKVLSTSQYMLMDINDDGVKDIIFRDSDMPYACYCVFLVKNGKLEVENFAYDGYDTLGYAKGGFSFQMHDDHMGMEGRTWATTFSQYKNGKEVMVGEDVTTFSASADSDETHDETFNSINGKEVTSEKYEKLVPKPIWFQDIKKGWRMVKNNQVVTYYSEDEYDIYDGKIGDYPVVLCFEKNKHDGFYFYKSRPENKFTLKCENKSTENNNTILEVKEYLPDGNSTGTFKGEYRKGSSFSGTFTNSEGKEFDFSMYWK